MAMSKSAVTVFSIMALFGAAMATTYTVGDDVGWTIKGSPDYEKWADDKTFKVGDTLFFKYNSAMHDVKQVSEADYEACNGKSPIATHTTGADSITLKEPGKAYFLCSFTGHCQMGQKLEISVVGSAAASPDSSPAASPDGAAAAAPKSATASSSSESAVDASTPTASVAGGVAPTAPTSSESSSSSSTKLTAGLVSAVLSVAAVIAF